MYKMDQKQYLHEVGQNLADLFYNRNKMEAKLILKKTSTGFYLWRNPLDKSQELLGATVPIMNDNGVDLREYTISLKNCQAIERGYDLDELVKGFIERTGYNDFDSYSYKLGFQKALELLGDKKFSEEDIRKVVNYMFEQIVVFGNKVSALDVDRCIQSLQQNEWDVEIVMEDSIGIGDKYTPDTKPKLDENGCLILKRK